MKKFTSRLMKLNHTERRTRYPIRYSHEHKLGSLSRKERTKKVWKRIPIVKNFVFQKIKVFNKGVTQNWNPDFPHELDSKISPRYIVPRHIIEFCEYLKDLFCIEQDILLDIRYAKNNESGMCYYKVSKDHYMKILIGARGGLRATTLIHEFIHAAGYDHRYEINTTHDFRSCSTLDNYSPLICKDVFGIREVFLT